MRKILLIVLILLLLIVSLLYFELPFNLISPAIHTNIINKYADSYEIDPIFIISMVKVESNFLHKARSHRGAIGLMQLMPDTAKELAEELKYNNFDAKYLENPNVNIHLGTYYLSKLFKEFNNNKILTLAAYNAGKSKVMNWYRQNPLMEVEVKDIPYKETKSYIKSVMRTYKCLKWIQELKNIIRKNKTA
ncbi:MAG: lytic transglycosylase domain-containing protein [Endomicrobiales bacterium]|nr:lytic transglycosylase domain-containing protein [Endomicrobiales bacterium]